MLMAPGTPDTKSTGRFEGAKANRGLSPARGSARLGRLWPKRGGGNAGLVAGVGDLSDLSAVLPGRERRRHRRPARHHRAAGLCRRPRGRRDLAVADLHLADGRHGLRRLGLYRHRPDLRHARRLRRADGAGARARAQGHHRPGAVALLRPASRSSARAGRAATTPRPTGTSGPTRSTTARRRTTGSRSSAAAPGMGGAAPAVLPAQLPRRAAGLQLPQSRGAGLAARRPCGSGWSAASTASASTPSTSTSTTSCSRDDPPDFRRKDKPEWNPYGMQYHLFSKNQPENLAFLERMRTLLDEYEARAMVGEMGESHHAIRMMGEYTTGRRLHKCYSFEMLDYQFHRRALPRQDRGVLRRRARRLADLGLLEPRRACGHVTRWARHGIGREPLAKLAGGAAPVAAGLDLHLPGRGARPDRDRARVPRADRPAGHPLLAGGQGPRRLPDADGLGRRAAATPASRRGNVSPGCRSRRRRRRTHVAGQLGAATNSVLEFYRTMLRLRRETEELRTGRTRLLRRRRAGPRLHPRRHGALHLQPFAGAARRCG